MFCTNCGKEIADGVKFCPHCGTEVSNEPVNDELAATLTVDGGDYAVTADDLNHEDILKMRSFIFKLIFGVIGVAVVALGYMGFTKYQDYKAQIEHENWIYDTVVAGLNEVDDTVDVPCEPFDKDYVTKGDIEYHDFGKGNHRYVHYEVDIHFKEGDVWYDSFKDGMVTIHAYDFIDTDSGIKAYLYYGDLYDEVMKVFFSQNNNDGGTGNVTTEPTASPEPEPTEEPVTEENLDDVLIPKGTWPGPTDITRSVVEVLGLSSDADPKLQEIYDWCCKEVTNHYTESLPADCKHAFPWYFYPRDFSDWEYEGKTYQICFLNVYVPMDANVVQEGTPFADTIDNYFEINISYCKDFDLLKITCPNVESGEKACNTMDEIERAWNSKHQSK